MFRILKKSLSVFLVVAVFAAGIPLFGMGGLNLFFNNISADAVTKLTTDNFIYTVSNNEATIVGYDGSPFLVTIPSTLDDYTVTAIGKNAFNSEITMLSLTLPNTVKTIGEKAFYNCYALRTLSIGSGVNSIGELAFARCKNITSVTIPKYVTTLGDGAFAYCTSLAGFDVASGNSKFSSTGNILLNHAKTSIIAYPASKSGESFTVPAAVRSIGSYAFSNAVNLTEVVLQSNVTNINAYAFAGSSVKKINMSDSKLTTIGAYAFEDCKQFSTVTLPGTVSAVGAGAFSGCVALKAVTLSSKMTVLSDYLFDGCKLLSQLAIPSTLKTIGKASFRACSSLTTATIPNAVTSIGSQAFKDCSSLKTFTLGSGVSSITGDLFEGCIKLTKFKVSEDEYYSVSDGILMNKAKTRIVCYPAAKATTSYTVPSAVTRIGTSAFVSCSKLKSLTIPSTVTTIDSEAVSDCSLLTIYCTENSAAEKYFDDNTSGYCTLRVNGTSPIYVVSNVSGKAGQTVSVTVSINNNPGLIAAAFTVNYDSAKVSLQSVKSGGILKGFSYKNYSLLHKCKIEFSGANTSTNITSNGVLITMTFKLHSFFTSGTSAITIIPDNSSTYNADFDEKIIKTSNGNIIIGNSSAKSGDVNGDGNIDGKDATILHRYVAGWPNITISNDASDVNADGNVNGKDATILRRYVAGWTGITLS